jgi:hypothetical protein
MSRRGIKMLIGTFMWFGTDSGNALRQYAADRNIPLAWAFNPTIETECGVGPQPPPSEGCTAWGPEVPRPRDTVAIRLLDPIVLRSCPEGHNFTVDTGTIHPFNATWHLAAVELASNRSFVHRMKAAKSLWSALVSNRSTVSALGVEPLYASACSSQDCVGVRVASQHCVCAKEGAQQYAQK